MVAQMLDTRLFVGLILSGGREFIVVRRGATGGWGAVEKLNCQGSDMQ